MHWENICNKQNINCKILKLGKIKKKYIKTPKVSGQSVYSHKKRFRELDIDMAICSTSPVTK